MSKVFNVSADCKPDLHYMVDISNRLEEIRKLIDKGEYFAINRARQYGKTTTLRALSRFLRDNYIVVSLDFQKLGDAKFRNERAFSAAFATVFIQAIKRNKQDMTKELSEAIDVLQQAIRSDSTTVELFELFLYLSDICAAAKKPIVLMIDEVDSATNNQVFLDFLAQLRAYYIDRDATPTFQSVILAGVYDVKNLKRKIREDEDHKVNSPWNIAADFHVDMSFSAHDIAGMLKEYEAEHHTGMDTEIIAGIIYEYTSGYPFLVSKLCKLLDEVVVREEQFSTAADVWTTNGVLEAVKILLSEKNTLFESMVNKLRTYQELHEIIYAILFHGKTISFNPLNPVIETAVMFGFIKNVDGTVVIANRIFETVFYNLFLTSSEMQESDIFKAALQD